MCQDLIWQLVLDVQCSAFVLTSITYFQLGICTVPDNQWIPCLRKYSNVVCQRNPIIEFYFINGQTSKARVHLLVFITDNCLIFIFVKSTLILFRHRITSNWILTILIWGGVFISEYKLFEIFFQETWPTFLPHIIITVAVLLFLIQLYSNRPYKI